MAPPEIAAVLFDLDGTLVDTEALCNETGVAACAALGLAVSLEFFKSLAGIHDAERARRIAAHTGRAVDRAAFYAEWDRLTTARMAAGIPLRPGARALLDGLRARNVPLALVTSSRRGPALEKLAAAGIGDAFDLIVTVEDVTRPKPDPDPYLAAASALGVATGACVVFEDSEPGVRSAHAAGCIVVQVPDIHGTDGRHAHHVAATLTEGARQAGLA